MPSKHSLNSDYPLDAEQVAQFQRDGHVLLRRAAAQEDYTKLHEFT
jgi:hypothetical protein